MTSSQDGARSLREINERNLARTIGWVSVVDSKAKFILSVILILTAYVISRSDSLAATVGLLWHAEAQVAAVLLIALNGVALVSTLVSFFLLVATVYPKRDSSTGSRSCLYYEHIADMEADAFAARMGTMTDKEAIDSLSGQTYNIAKVVKRKFDQLSTSVAWFYVGLVTFLVYCILHAIFAQLHGS